MRKLRIVVDMDGVIDDLSPGINRAVKRDPGADFNVVYVNIGMSHNGIDLPGLIG